MQGHLGSSCPPLPFSKWKLKLGERKGPTTGQQQLDHVLSGPPGEAGGDAGDDVSWPHLDWPGGVTKLPLLASFI